METDKSKSTVRYSLFNLSGQLFGIEIGYIKRIIALPKVTRLPNVGDFVEGVYSLRGLIVTLINLRQLLGIDEKSAGKTDRVILVEYQGDIFSFCVDEIKDFIDIPPDNIQPLSVPQKGQGKPVFEGEYTSDKGESIQLFAIDKLFKAGKGAIRNPRKDA